MQWSELQLQYFKVLHFLFTFIQPTDFQRKAKHFDTSPGRGMNTRNTILFLALIFCIGFTFKNPIDSSVSGYNGIIIGQSKLTNLKTIYGLNYKIETRTISIRLRTKARSEYVTFHKISYPNKGISFIIFSDDVDEGTVDKIIFTSRSKSKTDKNIVIGKSSFEDVIKNYGTGYWNSGSIFYSNKLSLSYERITFKTDKIISGSQLKEIDKNEFSKLIITEIELHLSSKEE